MTDFGTNLVPSSDIERIVGASRHDIDHIARAVSAEQTVYILHSRECLQSGHDLRECPYSLALEQGINPADWVEDTPVVIGIAHDRLIPLLDAR